MTTSYTCLEADWTKTPDEAFIEVYEAKEKLQFFDWCRHWPFQDGWYLRWIHGYTPRRDDLAQNGDCGLVKLTTESPFPQDELGRQPLIVLIIHSKGTDGLLCGVYAPQPTEETNPPAWVWDRRCLGCMLWRPAGVWKVNVLWSKCPTGWLR